MPENIELARRIWGIFTEPTPPQRKAYMDNLRAEGRKPIHVFSAFNPEHMKIVKQLVGQWDEIVNEKGRSQDELLHFVLDNYLTLRARQNPDLLYFSLEVFLTHYKGDALIGIPSILAREPELTAPSVESRRELAVGSPGETSIDWFREDPLLNEHHAHWHVVYVKNKVYDRQGEMFLYMHQQMLARYDAERIGEKVERVIPFSDLGKPIRIGYVNGPDERLSEQFMTDRPVDALIAEADVEEHRAARKALVNDIASGKYDPDPAIADPLIRETSAINSLGSTLEQNVHPQSDWDVPYPNYHGSGHGYIGSLNNGVMFDPQVAVRDVIFWEWHKEVDSHYISLQEKMDPYDFSKDAPPVQLRKGSDDDGAPDSMDIILCMSKNIPGFGKPGFNGKEIGEAAFGKTNWERDFGKGSFNFTDMNNQSQRIDTVDTLTTAMKDGIVKYRINGVSGQYKYTYLNHEPFSYFIRVENTSHEEKQVTVRIFIAPESHMNDRTMWIELDKFLYELLPNSRTVIFRNDTESSVVRKPAVQDPSTHNIVFDPVAIRTDAQQCKCGWPYHLLLPKGEKSATGSAYRLVVMVSDATIDSTKLQQNCGSLSFCGVKDSDYPDKRPLGYPFNRRFVGNGAAIINTVTTQPNFACRSIRIRHD